MVFDQYKSDIDDFRTTTALVVQFASAILGTAQIYVVGTIINFASRLTCAQRSVTLTEIGFWSAAATPKTDFHLPLGRVLLLVLLLAASNGPGAIWAGALTPRSTDRDLKKGLTLAVPQYTYATHDTWDSQFLQLDDNKHPMNHTNQNSSFYAVDRSIFRCRRVTNKIGRIYSCPVPDYSGSLLDSAGSASPILLAPRSHSKLDNSSWIFQDRSYGVGSSLGIKFPQGLTESAHLTMFNYTESGYAARVTCINNNTANYTLQRSSDWDLTDVASGLGTSLGIRTVAIGGELPNLPSGQTEKYSTARTPTDSIFAWSAVSHFNRNLIAIAASKNYTQYQNVQCEIDFARNAFQVSVNTTQQTINVLSVNSSGSPPGDIDRTGDLVFNTVLSVDLLSRISSNIGVSALGDPIVKNAEAYAARENMSEEDAMLPALEASIEAIVDDLLVAFGSAQLGIADSYSPEAHTMTELWGTYQGIKIGSDLYIFASLAINFSLILLAIYEAFRTGLWQKLTAFNFMDTQSLVVATSKGGTSIAEVFERRRGGRAWTGGPGDQEGSMIKIRLSQDEKTIKLVAASEESSVSIDRSNLLDHRSQSFEMVPFDDETDDISRIM